MFFYGLALGLFVGMPIGALVLCLCRASACQYQYPECDEVDDERR